MALSARKLLARRIKALRHSRGWSQEVLAELCGLNRSYIGAVERAEHNIGLDNIQRIAAALETSLTDLVREPVADSAVNGQFDAEQTMRHPANTVIIHRQSLLNLIAQADHKNGELIVTYLQRCGIIIRDS